MKENKDQPRKVGTCFEGSPWAEMMQRILSEGGIGSLCEGMMRAMAKRFEGGRQEPREDKRPAREGKTDQELRAARGRTKDQQTGGVK